MKKLLILPALSAALAAPSTYACMQHPPQYSFIFENDRNQDGKLSRREWRNAEIGNFFVAFRLGSLNEFKALDQNRNGLLDDNELAEKVLYRREPCADWLESMRKHSETRNNKNGQEPQSEPAPTP